MGFLPYDEQIIVGPHLLIRHYKSEQIYLRIIISRKKSYKKKQWRPPSKKKKTLRKKPKPEGIIISRR
jgi:hypothetical protein